jgi:hypothetical protein
MVDVGNDCDVADLFRFKEVRLRHKTIVRI